jgi:FKBP-type peptidyl-prolyl cis-trans isomerase 2
MQIQQGSKVKVHYTGKLETGEIFDTSYQDGREPLEFVVGQGQMIQGFETGIIGMQVGEKRTISMLSENAYGPVRDDLLFEVPMTNVPEGVQIGNTLQAEFDNGAPVIFTVTDIKLDTVILDGNHPLAGKNLTFDIELVDLG